MPKPTFPALIKGQTWKTSKGYIRIGDIGKMLVHYRILKKPEQRAVRAQMANADSLIHFLKADSAELLANPK